MTLEEAAEKVFSEIAHGDEEHRSWLRDALLKSDALKSYGDQRFIEGATAMREIAALKAYVAAPTRDIGKNVEQAVRALDPNQLKDTDHG